MNPDGSCCDEHWAGAVPAVPTCSHGTGAVWAECAGVRARCPARGLRARPAPAAQPLPGPQDRVRLLLWELRFPATPAGVHIRCVRFTDGCNEARLEGSSPRGSLLLNSLQSTWKGGGLVPPPRRSQPWHSVRLQPGSGAPASSLRTNPQLACPRRLLRGLAPHGSS